jgi:F0F1-type ATP synthase assembly protein I
VPDASDKDETPDTDALAARIEKLQKGDAPPEQSGTTKSLALVGLGTTFVGCLLAGWYGGLWFDKHYGTQYGSVIGMLLGLAGGAMGSYQLLKPFLNT